MTRQFGRIAVILAGLTLLSACGTIGQKKAQEVGAPIRWQNALQQESDWYSSPEAIRIADNLLAYQRPCGGWGKIGEMTAVLANEQLAAVQEKTAEKGRTYDAPEYGRYSHRSSSIDNNATHSQVNFLARVYCATQLARLKAACLRGIEYLLSAQYPNGGWPQCYPNLSGYGRRVTFNDNAMTAVLRTLERVGRGSAEYRFVDAGLRRRVRIAVKRGIRFILDSQIVSEGKRTAWCQQHDEKTLQPRGARIYEKPSISGNESVDVVRFLMSIERPNREVVRAVQAAVAWFDRSRITGIRVAEQHDPSKDKVFHIAIREDPEGEPGMMEYKGTGLDRVVVEAHNAPPIWARFYELETNRPIFAGWDGKVRYSLAEIDHERRMRYSWYGSAPSKLLNEDYPTWLKKQVPGRNVLSRTGR